MKQFLLQNKKKIISAVIYFLLGLGIAGLLYMNRAGKEYQMFNHIQTLTEGETVLTPELTLPAGNYYMVVNYAVSQDSPITVYIDETHQIMDTLTANPECAYYTLSFSVARATSQFHLQIDDAFAGDFQMFNYELTADRVLNSDDTYFAIAFFILAGLAYLFFQSKRFWSFTAKQKTVLLAMLGVTLFASYPLFTDYLIYGHDLAGHLIRIEGVKDALVAGQFPVAVYPSPNNGYGLLGFIYPNFFLLFPAFLRICNVSMVTSYQTLLLLINLATAAVVYFSVKSVSKSEYAALIAGVLYVLSPYRLSDMYIRGALGETLAMIFLPAALAGLYHIFLGEKKKWYLLVIGYTGILQSHVLSCLLIGFVSAVIGIALVRHLFEDRRYLALLKAAGAFLLLNLWYLIPFFVFYSRPLGMGTIENKDFYEQAVFMGQLFMTKASTYIPLKTYEGITVEMQLSLGIAGAVALLLLLVYLFENKKKDCFVKLLAAISILTIFLASTLFPWKRLAAYETIGSIMGMIQFPFRFLTISTVGLAFASGIAIVKSDILVKYKEVLFAVLLVLSLVSVGTLLDTYITEDIFVTDVSGGFSQKELPEYWPEGTDKAMFADKTPWENNAQLSDYQKDGMKISFSYMADGSDAFVTLPLLYFPGYYAKLADGTALKVDMGEGNRVRVWLPQYEESQSVSLKYSYWRILN